MSIPASSPRMTKGEISQMSRVPPQMYTSTARHDISHAAYPLPMVSTCIEVLAVLSGVEAHVVTPSVDVLEVGNFSGGSIISREGARVVPAVMVQRRQQCQCRRTAISSSFTAASIPPVVVCTALYTSSTSSCGVQCLRYQES